MSHYHARCAQRRTAESRNTFRNQVYIFDQALGQIVEEEVQLNKVHSLHIPVRLLDLAVQIKRVGQLLLINGIMVLRKWPGRSFRVTKVWSLAWVIGSSIGTIVYRRDGSGKEPLNG